MCRTSITMFKNRSLLDHTHCHSVMRACPRYEFLTQKEVAYECV